MRTEPDDLDAAILSEALARHWSFDAVSVEYAPLGFGSHHWTATDEAGDRRFLTVDDLRSPRLGADPEAAFATLARAFRATAALRDEAELEFAVGPLAATDGSFLQPIAGRYAMAVFPFVDGHVSTEAGPRPQEERDAALRVLGRLHGVDTGRLSTLPAGEDFRVPDRERLHEALRDLDRPWDSGPYGERARRLLRADAAAVERLLAHYDELAADVRQDGNRWVITHGEPHSGNLLRDGRGGTVLVDWDTLRLAPPERDLWMVLDESADLSGYRAAGGRARVDDRTLRLYRLWWDLSEIASFVGWFRDTHARTADTAIAWEALANYLPVRQHWPEIADRGSPRRR